VQILELKVELSKAGAPQREILIQSEIYLVWLPAWLTYSPDRLFQKQNPHHKELEIFFLTLLSARASFLQYSFLVRLLDVFNNISFS